MEHARLSGGSPDVEGYGALRDAVIRGRTRGVATKTDGAYFSGAVTAFVGMGKQDDTIDGLLDSTLLLNSYFQSVILKPYGYSPDCDPAHVDERRSRWSAPCSSSPQWFPYVGHGSELTLDDYQNLVRWQNLVNKRVKGSTFDFLDQGNVARLVRDTLIAESWKRRREGV